MGWGWGGGGTNAADTYSRQPYHLHVLTAWKSLEPQPPGTLCACTGIALPFFFLRMLGARGGAVG